MESCCIYSPEGAGESHVLNFHGLGPLDRHHVDQIEACALSRAGRHRRLFLHGRCTHENLSHQE